MLVDFARLLLQTKSYARLMAVMMSPREKWTDERLDDLDRKVDKGFSEVGARFDRLETRMDAQFANLNDRFDRMQYTLIGGFAVMVAALIGAIATLAGIALF